MKVFGVGTDIVQHARIRRIVEAKYCDRFMVKVLHHNEIEQMKAKKTEPQKIQFLASRWAVKESLVKASNRIDLVFPELEISKSEGSPVLIAHGRTSAMLAGMDVKISISHEEEYSLAFVLLCK